MSSFDKTVRLACKPKSAAPKAKYLDPIIAATWSDEGAVHDVCKALSPRLREPNTVVVFKALIVLHTMIRNGSTDNVLSHLSSADTLRLRNVSSGNWEGYSVPQNIQNYATYLDSRIHAYGELKHDAILVQSETNRDMRNSTSIEEHGRGRQQQKAAVKALGPSRSKTIMGRKLRSMTVEKGLLRETKAVHKQIDALVECRFYLDDLEDELTITALRMLVKDLLILFQAGNEGVINLLEQYFEMSHVDAEEALGIYKRFCKQTEKVMEYLGVAKKLQNLLNVPIPNLKHAPVSLAKSLQEYLDDPHFEQNRIEYKATRDSVDKREANGTTTPKPKAIDQASTPTASTSSTLTSTTDSKPSKPAAPPISKKEDIDDFFGSIEEETHTAQRQVSIQVPVNPFARPMITGQPFMQPQVTGFPFQPQPAPINPFGLSVPQQVPQPTGRPLSAFVPNQLTGAFGFQPNFLQPQPTGANPFRQSMIVPQTTGMAMFGVGSAPATMNSFSPTALQVPPGPFNHTAFAAPSSPVQQLQQPFATNPAPVPTPFGMRSASNMNGPPIGTNQIVPPPRPGSAPLSSFVPAGMGMSPPTAQPIKTHQTGTRNPFGRIATPPPPVPKQPTLMELAMGPTTTTSGAMNGVIGFSNANTNGATPTVNGLSGLPGSTSTTLSGAGTSAFGFNAGALSAGAVDMGSIASTFAFNSSKPATTNAKLEPQTTASTVTTSLFSDSLFGSSFGSQQTGSTNTSTSPSISISPTGPTTSSLQPQTTGFSGLKPFKPSSSFGAALLGSLPPIPASPTPTGTNTNGVGGLSATSTLSNGIGGSARFGSGLSGLSSTSAAASPSSQPAPGVLTGALNAPSTPFNASALGTPFGAGLPNTTPTPTKTLLGTGLRPQMTGGAGAANPFRASMMALGTGVQGINPGAGIPPLPMMGFQQQPPPSPFPAFGGSAPGATGMGSTGASLFGSSTPATQQQQATTFPFQSQQQQSLI